MALNDVEMALYIRGVPAPSSTILSLSHSRRSPSIDLPSRQQNYRSSFHRIDSRTGHLDTTRPTSGWRRHSEKTTRLHPAPDVAYRNTYLQEAKQDQLDIHVSHFHSRSPSTSQFPQGHFRNESPTHKYQSYTIYDYIHNSIRQIEQQRQVKRDLSLHVQRPQNEDRTLKHVLSKRKTSLSRNSSIEVPSAPSETEINGSPTITNYMKHLRLIQLPTSNQSHRQKQRI